MIAVPVMSYNGFTPIVLVLWLLISPIKHRFVVAAKEEHTRMNEWALCYEAVRSGGSIVGDKTSGPIKYTIPLIGRSEANLSFYRMLSAK